MASCSIHPETIRVSETTISWNNRTATFNSPTSPVDLANAYFAYYDSGHNFLAWARNKDIRNPATKKEWQRIKKLVLETLYLFETMATPFMELYVDGKLPFDAVGRACVFALQNPTDEEGIATLVDILAEYSSNTREVLLASIPICQINWHRSGAQPTNEPAYLYGPLDMLKRHLVDEINIRYSVGNISENLQEAKNIAFSEIAALSHKYFTFYFPDERTGLENCITALSYSALECKNGYLMHTLKMV